MPRRGHNRDDYLFYKYDFRRLQDANQQQLRKAIDDADAAVVKAGTVDEAAELFANQFRAIAPELTEGAISVEIEEAQVDVTGDIHYAAWGPGPHNVPGIRASYYVPFVGDAEMFRVTPTTFTTVLPAAAIEGSELRFTFERPGQPVDETKQAFEEQLSRVKQYLGWLRENFNGYNAALLPLAKESVTARRARLSALEQGTSSLGIQIRRAPVAHSPLAQTSRGPTTVSATTVEPNKQYDVALSFAGENRAYVEEVANGLKANGVEVFYDAFEKAGLWGKNLVDHLAEIYQRRSKYVVMFISEQYVAKAWPSHERQHAQARALLAKDEYILPTRFDDTEVPGMTNTVGHIDLRAHSPAELVALILQKLGRKL